MAIQIVKALGKYYVYKSAGVLGRRMRIGPPVMTKKQAEGIRRNAKRRTKKK